MDCKSTHAALGPPFRPTPASAGVARFSIPPTPRSESNSRSIGWVAIGPLASAYGAALDQLLRGMPEGRVPEGQDASPASLSHLCRPTSDSVWLREGVPDKRPSGTVLVHDVSMELPALAGDWCAAPISFAAGAPERGPWHCGFAFWHAEACGGASNETAAALLFDMLDAGMPSVCNAETADGAARGWRLIGRYSWGNRGEPDPAVQANLPEAMRIPQGVDTGNCLFVPVDKFWGEVMPALHRLAASRQNASQSPPAPVQLAGPRTYGDDGLSLLVGPDSAPFGTATFAEDQEYMYGRVLVSRSATGPVEGVKAFIWYTGYCNGFAESFVGGQRVCQPLGQAVEPGQPGAAEAMAAMGDADLASWFASQPFECRRVAVEGAARAPEPELLRRLRSLGLVFAPPAVVRGTAPQVTPPGPAPQSWRPCISPVGFLSALQAARQALKVDVGTPPPPTDSSYPTWFLSAEAKVNSAMQGPSTSACELLSLVTSDPRLLPSWLATDAIDPDFLGSLPAAELGMLTALLDICMAAAGGDPAPVGRLIDRAGLLAAAADEFQSDAEWSGILLAAYLPLIARCGGSLRTSRMPGSEGALLEAALRGPPPARYQKGMPDPVALPRFKETVDAVRAMDPSWDWAASKGFWLRAPSAMPSPGPEPGEQLLLGSLADSVLVLSACGWAESAARNQTGDPIAAAAPVNAVIRSLADDYGCRSSLPSADTATVAVVGLVVRGQQPGAADPPWKAGLDAFIGAAMSD